MPPYTTSSLGRRCCIVLRINNYDQHTEKTQLKACTLAFRLQEAFLTLTCSMRIFVYWSFL